MIFNAISYLMLRIKTTYLSYEVLIFGIIVKYLLQSNNLTLGNKKDVTQKDNYTKHLDSAIFNPFRLDEHESMSH